MEEKNWFIIRQFSQRNRKLKAAGYENYAEFLSDVRWKKIHELWIKKKRKGIRHWKVCYCCESPDRLQLHHLKYQNILRPVLGTSIVPVCDRCHAMIHELTRKHPKWSIKSATKKLHKMLHRPLASPPSPPSRP